MIFKEPEQPTLVHLIYTSAISPSLDKDEILEILKAARTKNAKLGVTGMLLFDEGDFFQILEGDADVVNRLFATIGKDKRHHQVTKVILEPIPERNFSDWTMGYSKIPRTEIETIDGLNDFFTTGKSLHDLDEGRARKLLDAFKEGKWRSSLSGRVIQRK